MGFHTFSACNHLSSKTRLRIKKNCTYLLRHHRIKEAYADLSDDVSDGWFSSDQDNEVHGLGGQNAGGTLLTPSSEVGWWWTYGKLNNIGELALTAHPTNDAY